MKFLRAPNLPLRIGSASTVFDGDALVHKALKSQSLGTLAGPQNRLSRSLTHKRSAQVHQDRTHQGLVDVVLASVHDVDPG